MGSALVAAAVEHWILQDVKIEYTAVAGEYN
jgi:hypothetical protein